MDKLGFTEVRRIAFGEAVRNFSDWLAAFNAFRPREIWAALGPWIEEAHPKFGAKTAARFAAVHEAATKDTTKAQTFRDAGRRKVAELLGSDGVLLLPTVPMVTPKRGIDDAEAPALRERIFRLTCLSPMLGFPEITLPLATVDQCPMDLSLLGPQGGDAMLLEAAAKAG